MTHQHEDLEFDSAEPLQQMVDEGKIGMDTFVYDCELDMHRKVRDILEPQSAAAPSQFPDTPVPKRRSTAKIVVFSVVGGILGLILILGIVGALLGNRDSGMTRDQEVKASQKIAAIWRSALGGEFKKEPVDKETYGKAASAIQFTEDLYSDINDAVAKLKAAYVEADLNSILTQETLENPDNLKTAITNSQKIIDTISETESSISTVMESYTTKADDLDLPKDFKKGFITGLKSTKDGSIKQIKDFYAIEKKIMNKAVDILKYMDSMQGKYTFMNGQAVFSQDADVNVYNQMITDLQKYAKEETDYQQKLMQKNQDKLNEYEKALEKYMK